MSTAKGDPIHFIFSSSVGLSIRGSNGAIFSSVKPKMAAFWWTLYLFRSSLS